MLLDKPPVDDWAKKFCFDTPPGDWFEGRRAEAVTPDRSESFAVDAAADGDQLHPMV